jgi:hypothetical protein
MGVIVPATGQAPGLVYRDGGGNIVLPPGEQIVDQHGTAAGAGLSPLIWGDLPLMQMAMNPQLGFYFFDDCLNVPATTAKWTVAGANGTVAQLATGTYGVMRCNAVATDNNESFVTSGNNVAGMIKLDGAKDWAFEARIQINQIATAQGVFVGLTGPTQMGADFMTDDTMALKVQDYLGYQIISATDIAAVFQSVHCKTSGARAAVSATAHTPAATTWIKLGMKSVGTKTKFYVNGVELADSVLSTATNYPLNVICQIIFATKAGTSAQQNLDVDWVAAAQLR